MLIMHINDMIKFDNTKVMASIPRHQEKIIRDLIEIKNTTIYVPKITAFVFPACGRR